MKDAAGRVIYVGKAKNLRSRAGSYFLKAAAEDRRTADLVREIRDIDYLEAESEVDALLMEARLIKDIQPKYNQDLKDDKTFPYLRDHHPRGLSPRGGHARAAATGHQALRAVRQRRRPPRGDRRCCRRSSSSAPARWTSTKTTSGGGGSGPACWPRSTSARPRATCGSRKEEYRKDIRRLQTFLDGKQAVAARRRCGARWRRPPTALRVRGGRPAARRDPAARNARPARRAGHARPARGVSRSTRRRAWPGCRRCSSWPTPPRTIEGVDIAHLGGTETVASLVQFIDGLPFKPGYRRYRIRDGRGRRRLRAASTRWSPGGSSGSHDEGDVFPDILLIDGGKGQLERGAGGLRRAGDRRRPW